MPNDGRDISVPLVAAAKQVFQTKRMTAATDSVQDEFRAVECAEEKGELHGESKDADHPRD